MAELDYPDPLEQNPWVDQNGQSWKHDGEGWRREYNAFTEAPEDGVQYGLLNSVWVAIPVLEAPVDGAQYVRASLGWKKPTAPPATIHRQTGHVFHFAGISPPSGSFECKGQEIGKSSQPDLYAAIGDLWATTGNVAPPASANFRLPPSFIQSGKAVYIRGRRNGTTVVGQHFDQNNKEHSHSANHDHSGSVDDDGGHDHRVTYDIDSSVLVSGTTLRSPNNSGITPTSQNTSIDTSRHTHNVTIETKTLTTDNSGSGAGQPESIGHTLCIWL